MVSPVYCLEKNVFKLFVVIDFENFFNLVIVN